MRNPRIRVPVIIGAVILLAIGVYYIPPVHERLAWRVDGLRTQVKYFFNPPDEAIFQPSEQQQVEAIVSATLEAFLATPTRTPTPRPGPSLTPTITTTPLPQTVMLEGVTYEHQHGRLNYCGPANFSMSLTFWGWDGDRDVIGRAVKPSDKDKNVMPYELQDYITDNVPGMTSILRYGGEIEMIKRLVAAGFPVVVEKGIYELDLNGKFGWMGHYAFVTGYDETKQELIYQDTYQPPGAPPGPNRRISYDDFEEGWRSFNFVFVVVYPVEREGEVLSALGRWADEAWATRHALERAQAEGQSLTGIDQFFAWFNAGTSHVDLLQYADAAFAYDYAFQLYAALDVDKSIRPYRMMWYQTGPYKAYFYSGRYADVISLADTTLHDTISEPVLEESLYWRGQAEYMTGRTGAAIADYRAALKVHPKWLPALQALEDLGVEP